MNTGGCLDKHPKKARRILRKDDVFLVFSLGVCDDTVRRGVGSIANTLGKPLADARRKPLADARRTVLGPAGPRETPREDPLGSGRTP